MVNMQGCLIFMSPAKLAAVLGSLEDFIPYRARDIAVR
jgi:hypothetical protein